MNTEEIIHLLKNLLAHSRARFLGVFASDKLPPLNTIQSLIPCCLVSNIDPTGKGRSHCVDFSNSRPTRLEFFDSYGREPCEFDFSFPKSLQIVHNPYQIQAFEPRSVGIFVHTFSIIDITIMHWIQYVKDSQYFHMFVQLQLFLHLFVMHTKE